MFENTMWVGVPRSEIEKHHILEGDLNGRFAYFRHVFELKDKATLKLHISANSRYRLWVNGTSITAGPCKGDLSRQYYETVDVSEYLQTGNNVLAVQVLFQDIYASLDALKERSGIYAVHTPGGGHRLAVEGTVTDADGNHICDVSTGIAGWKVILDATQYVHELEVVNLLGAIAEEVDFNLTPNDWKLPEFADEKWVDVNVLESVQNSEFNKSVGVLRRFQMKERPIPLLYEEERTFEKKYEDQNPDSGLRRMVFDAGKIVNGYPKFVLKGMEQSTIKITYLEKFEPDSQSECKEVRRDYIENGRTNGLVDLVTLPDHEVVFEPFWVRTFRFICIESEQEESFEFLKEINYRRTGYPLCPESEVHSSAGWVEKLWDMCVNTLENCMLETYMDCPYYEQLQYPMDTRLQALFNYSASKDDRLAYKALEDFHCSMTQDGLILGKAPTAYPQIISTFSLYYIIMIREYYDHTRVFSDVRRYMPDIDRILDYYDLKIGEDGMVGNPGFWPFVDWQDAWKDNAGVPVALLQGPSTIINLMYAYALKDAADLYEIYGRSGMAEEYRERRAKILKEVKASCWDDERELFREGPDCKQYSRHAQAWAILNDMVDKDTARRMIKHASEEMDVLKCSFSTSYEWFRACEMTGVYEITAKDMEDWIQLIDLGCTCCPEVPVDSRSECHAWSALPMYELVRVIAGVKETSEDGKILIQPRLQRFEGEDHPYLRGKVVTSFGLLSFDYEGNRAADGSIEWNYKFELPEGFDGELEYPDGRRVLLRG